jgi:hypothetical protein
MIIVVAKMEVIENNAWRVMSYFTKEGVAYINDKPAARCEQEDCFHKVLELSDNICPDCQAHLAKDGICLNGCHLTGGQFRRFQQAMNALAAKHIKW